MKKITRTLCLMLAMLFIASVIVLPIGAARSYTATTYYGSYTTATLNKGVRNAYVTVKVWNANFNFGSSRNRNDVKLTTTSGRYILGCNGYIANNGSVQLRLGNDNKAYRIYVRTQYGRASVQALYWSGCTVK